jgi:GrpB-like predicted nucleotidyltransferase (UPF0157 family)
MKLHRRTRGIRAAPGRTELGRMSEGPIALAPYDPAWPARFLEARARIAAACGARVAAIEHVGSTAVPGLLAKPVIDVLAGVRDLDDAGRTIARLEAAGYRYRLDLEWTFPARRYFTRDGEHVHMVVEGDPFWRRHLVFRDRLRNKPETAAAYAALKRDLAPRRRPRGVHR